MKRFYLTAVIFISTAIFLLLSCEWPQPTNCEKDFIHCRNNCDELYRGGTSNDYESCIKNCTNIRDECNSSKEEDEDIYDEPEK